MHRQPKSTAGAVRVLAVWTFGLVLAIVMTWPLARGISHLGRTRDAADARFSVWNVAWVAHALTTDPRTVYNANIFHPHQRTLAFSEANLVAGALAAPVWWLTRNPFTSHNVVLLFAFAASVVVTWYLVRRLTGDAFAAAAAAITYSFCPYLFSHTTHIQLLMTAGIPLSMLALHRLVDDPTAGRGLSLGLALTGTALSCAYYGIFAALMVGYATIFYAWTRGAWRSARYWTAIATGAIVSLGLVMPFFLPYLSVQEETGFTRTLNEARVYAATWRSYLASAALAHRWMLPLIREWGGEVLFPGFAALAFGAIGFGSLVARTTPPQAATPAATARETALLYGSMGLLAFWSTLGPRAGLYTVFYEIVPIFSFLRAPGRMGLVVMLCLAVFAAFGVRALRARFATRATLVGIAACAAALVDLAQVPFPWLPAHPIPRSYEILARLPVGPVVEFPFYDRRIEYHLHTTYMLNSTVHWQPLINGYSDHIPHDFRNIAARLVTFPSRDAFQAMRERRVRYFTIHKDRYIAAARADVEQRLQEFLPQLKLLAEDERLAVFELAPGQWP